jgi:hypothetical protein
VSDKRPTQKAHLRVALHDNGKYQLVLRADIRGFDIYAGPPWPKDLLRSSWHESGKVHIHTPVGRDIGKPKVRPESFTGKAQLYQGGYSGLDWSYMPKPDSKTRRTLLIEKEASSRSLNCAIWAIERNRSDLWKEVLAEYDGSRGLVLVSHIAIDWTQPSLLAVVSTLSDTAWVSLNASKKNK